MNYLKDLTGQRFGKLYVVCFFEKTKARATRWKCICDCGNTKIVRSDHLVSGATKSCGCIVKKHGQYNTKLYSVWSGMLKRCFSPTNRNFKYYGARGISVCDEWHNNFIVFSKWATENGYKEGLAIDRIDNDGHYSPQNCRWVTSKENANNRSTNRIVEHEGLRKTVSEWASTFGIDYDIFYGRMYNEEFSIEKYLEKYSSKK